MSNFTRREFMYFSIRLAALIGAGSAGAPRIADALGELTARRPPVLWLQGLSCSGCSVSLLNCENPDPVQVLTSYISLRFHSTLSTATGKTCSDVIDGTVKQGGYYLALEGAIPQEMPHACKMGEKPIEELIVEASRAAKAVLAIGTCASFGGIPCAEGNPTGAVSVPRFLESKGISTPVIALPGCPAHPDWMVATLAHEIKFGLPPLDHKRRPKMFFSKTLHDQCPRFADYERERFARTFSEDGCFFKLGCFGPLTHADCTLRLWNGGANHCIKAGSPCIGCASENFALKAAFPMFVKNNK